MQFRLTRHAPAGLVLAACITATLAQEQPARVMLPEIIEDTAAVGVDSGVLAMPEGLSAKGDFRKLWSQEVHVDGATSVRLVFDRVQLAGSDYTGDASFLVITSNLDGHQQMLDAKTIKEWRHTSAYFNGDTVTVDLYATAGAGDNRVGIARAIYAGEGRPTRSICGSTDDRTLSNEARSGRVWPIGCTAWLFNDRPNCFLTAGHCGPVGSDVIEFNVPLSSASGTPQHPGPDDQYAVDPASIQSNGGLGVGNDYSYFGCFDNSNTGLSPFEAQGDSYPLATVAPSVTGQTIRVTGFGSTTSPVDPSWYLAQKTHTGPYFSHSGTTLQYQVDTSGGNSGSAVFDETDGVAIGIHTHAGCSTTSGNQGTAIELATLQAALANPQGICALGLDFDYPGGLPGLIDPAGGTAISVAVTGDPGITLDPSTVTFNVDTGSGFVAYPMTDMGGGIFGGAFPAADCGTHVAYYVSASNTLGDLYTDPTSGSYSVLSAIGVTVATSDDFETDTGWTVQDTALSTGSWDRGVPGNYGRSDPSADYDGSGQCYITGNSSGEDVDGGPTVLTSPAYDLTATNAPTLSYARWNKVDSGGNSMTVEITDGDGTWHLIETVGDTIDWTVVSVPVTDYVSLTNAVQVRFSVTDNPNTWVTEAGIDAFSITESVCSMGCSVADINEDGVLNLDDVNLFAAAFTGGDLAADMNDDGVLNLDDINLFAAAFTAGC
ncbi:MAG: GC-type dockerin domain-anchored protein [Phycisphaerales bacterium]